MTRYELTFLFAAFWAVLLDGIAQNVFAGIATLFYLAAMGRAAGESYYADDD